MVGFSRMMGGVSLIASIGCCAAHCNSGNRASVSKNSANKASAVRSSGCIGLRLRLGVEARLMLGLVVDDGLVVFLVAGFLAVFVLELRLVVAVFLVDVAILI